ncbi:efflux transporter outer membrane subunit [Serratia proteamaculans]|uniref:efflux transporter outer membrane subunit n=2 Tax=Serratia proteamaculans TaxID=28151 RepID=UPI00124A9A2C|nr:TolC family protein [Serratia proteamaculans]KAB1498546.1 TolC family protein [Serratia proteamaculans]CAI0767288.1 Outer membrane protein oprM precursor [Serratia proteamaculans]CAI0804020.1 Outer membrane protein oprM precursor [Serratia proteamaculans]CAI1187775.1 Outer membrane protein oprM precursor [Serratia proteamaculans]
MKMRYQALVAPLSALVLLSGCVAVGPDYTPPPLSSSAFPSGFANPAAGLSSGRVEVQWWRTFEEPALTRLVQQALAANHDIGIAAARLEEAKALLRENRQNFLPRGGPALSYDQRRWSETEISPDQPRQAESYRGAIDAAWEIDLFGRVRRSVEAAQAQAGSREALLRGVQASVAAEVAATWFELQGIEAELAVVAATRQNQRESLALVERRISAGSASEVDRLRAEALLRNVEAATPELERRRAAAGNALTVLLGETPQRFSPPAATATQEMLKVRTLAVGDPAALLWRRADIAAAERNLAAATAGIGVETAGLYPEIQITGSIGFVAGSLDAMSGAGALSSFIGPVIRWSLFDSGRVRARIAASEARAKQALILYDQTLLRALQETDDAFKAYSAAGSTLALRLHESAANREAARLARVRFSQGEGLYQEVLDAERSDFASRRALSVARIDQQLAIVSIYKALGGGWQACTSGLNDCRGADGTTNSQRVK